MGYFYSFLAYFGYDHPLHPTQINMPIGLVVGGLILAIAALKRADAAIGAKLAILLAFVFLFPTIVTGFMDWSNFYGAAWVYPFSIKVILGILLTALLLTALLAGRQKRTFSGVLLGIYFLAFANAIALGYFGGEAVFGRRAPEAPDAFTDGKIIFRYNCSGCHAYGGNTIQPDRPVIGAYVLGDPKALTAWIRNPPPPMPAYPEDKIPDAQAYQLADYLNHVWGNAD